MLMFCVQRLETQQYTESEFGEIQQIHTAAYNKNFKKFKVLVKYIYNCDNRSEVNKT